MITDFTRMTALAATLSLSACTVFPIPEPPRLMDLAPPPSYQTFDEVRPVSLRIDTPLASDPLDTTRILLKPSAFEFKALPDARWRDSIPVVVRDYLIQSFRQSDGFASVITDTSPATSDLTLITELTGFHAETSGNRNAVVIQLHAELLNNRSRQSLCVLDQRLQMPAASTTMEDLMAGFTAAAEELSMKTTQWAWECLSDN